MDRMENSILINTDSYKVSMWKQYPEKTEYVYSYIESRGGQYDKTVFFGVQAFIKEYLLRPITQAEIDFADMFWTGHGEPFNREGWQYILDTYAGKLPVRIKAAPEGLVIPSKNVLATIENTDPKCWWLTTWIETALLRAIWYPTTVATQSWEIKQLIKGYLERSGDVGGLGFKLHDFGARGVSSNESAMLGGMAHIINFMGTDTAVAIIGANRYYGAPLNATAFSIPAAEHSTITSWGRDNEIKAFENLVKQFGKEGGLVAGVSDSYNIFEAGRLWGKLKEQIKASGVTVVVRPDSGDPVEVLPKLFNILGEEFGYTKNDKGFKVLNNVRVIWGDGINYISISAILRRVVDMDAWSADNIAFGMGGALLQIVNRDTNKFAMKASAACVDGEWRQVFKDPITDKGKVSKKGRVTLFMNSDGEYYSGVEDWDMRNEVLRTVFENGELKNEMTFDQVRANSNA